MFPHILFEKVKKMEQFVIRLVFLLVVYASCEVVVARHHHAKHSKVFGGKIVGGYNSNITQEPYQVYLILQKGNEYYQCGGSIISQTFIATAAHCLNGMEKAYIRAGSTESDSGGMMYESTDLRMHPLYNSKTSDYDAGLIRIADGIQIDNDTTKIIQLPHSPAETDDELTVSGWGTTAENGNTTTTLMAVKVSVVNKKECNTKYNHKLTPRMFCAGQDGKDSCQGDSGGPARSDEDNTLQGIVSFGIGCARTGYPGVYTAVNNRGIKKWIKYNLSKE